MKASTESLINKAMEHNTDIQMDNLSMLEMCNSLCKRARTLKAIKGLESYIEKNKIDKMALEFLNATTDFSNVLKIDATTFLNLSKEDQTALALNKIDEFESNEKYQITSTLFAMLEASTKDLDEIIEFDKVKKLKDSKLIVYSKEAIDNITASLKSIVQTISFEHSANHSYEGLANNLINKLDEPMSLVHTKISKEGFVTIDVPQPKYQSLKEASVTSTKDIDDMNATLNSLTYHEMNKRIYNLKMSMSSRVNGAKDLEDTIKYAHLISQLLMSVKNSIKLMQNYHKASINELI